MKSFKSHSTFKIKAQLKNQLSSITILNAKQVYFLLMFCKYFHQTQIGSCLAQIALLPRGNHSHVSVQV
jgi:hypothetical protein